MKHADILIKLVLTIYFWLIVSIGSLTAFTMILYDPMHLFDHDFITFNIETYMASFIYFCMTKTGVWKVTIHNNLEKSYELDSVIIAPNHISLVDTLFVALMPQKKTYSYNKKWGWVPVFGWMSQMAGYISIDKNNKAKLAQIVPDVIKRIKNGYSIMMYPEGTRNKNPQTLSNIIKTGAFRIAKESGAAILPIVFVNTDKAVSYYGIVNYANIHIHILEPIHIGNRNFDDVCEQFRNSASGSVSINDSKNGIIDHNITVAMNKYRTSINSILSEYY